jgi:hypothetical protein
MIDDRTLLKTLHADRARPDDLALARARARLMARAQQSPGRAWWTGGPRLAVAAVATAGLVGGLVLVQTFTPSGASASAAEVLDRAAAAAGRQAPAPLPGPGQYLYVHDLNAQIEFVEGEAVDPGRLCFGAYESWTPADSATPARIHRADGVTPSSARSPGGLVRDPECRFDEFTVDGAGIDDGIVIDAGEPVVLPGGEAGGSWQQPDPSFVAALPTDPEALYQRARADAVELEYEQVDEGTLTLLTDAAISGSPHLTPALRAALFRAIAFVPGVELGGTVSTLWGDQGQVVSRVEPTRGIRTEIIFDPAGGDLLGSRDVAVDGGSGLPAGVVFHEQARRSGVVGAVGERPAG